jgi:hypothetical protein
VTHGLHRNGVQYPQHAWSEYSGCSRQLREMYRSVPREVVEWIRYGRLYVAPPSLASLSNFCIPIISDPAIRISKDTCSKDVPGNAGLKAPFCCSVVLSRQSRRRWIVQSLRGDHQLRSFALWDVRLIAQPVWSPPKGFSFTRPWPRIIGRPSAAFRLVNSVGIATSRVFGVESSRPASLLCTLRTHQSPSEWQHSLSGLSARL